jgi:hypothetical protein
VCLWVALWRTTPSQIRGKYHLDAHSVLHVVGGEAGEEAGEEALREAGKEAPYMKIIRERMQQWRRTKVIAILRKKKEQIIQEKKKSLFPAPHQAGSSHAFQAFLARKGCWGQEPVLRRGAATTGAGAAGAASTETGTAGAATPGVQRHVPVHRATIVSARLGPHLTSSWFSRNRWKNMGPHLTKFRAEILAELQPEEGRRSRSRSRGGRSPS